MAALWCESTRDLVNKAKPRFSHVTRKSDHLDRLGEQAPPIKCLQDNVIEARENLLTAKISQAKQANKTHCPEYDIKVGDHVKLSTVHQCVEYLKKGEKQVAKYMCWFDGPYTVVATHPECSTYMLSLPKPT
jgi:hypothetical protein